MLNNFLIIVKTLIHYFYPKMFTFNLKLCNKSIMEHNKTLLMNTAFKLEVIIFQVSKIKIFGNFYISFFFLSFQN